MKLLGHVLMTVAVSLLPLGGGDADAPGRKSSAVTPPIVAGCDALRTDGTCEVWNDHATLIVWSDGAQTSSVEVDGRPRQARVAMVEGGSQLTVDVSSSDRRLRLSTQEGIELLDLLIEHRPPSAKYESLREELRSAPASVRHALANRLGDTKGLELGEQVRLLGIHGRALLRENLYSEAVDVLESSIARSRELGLISTTISDSFVVLHTYLFGLDAPPAEIHSQLERIATLIEEAPYARAELAYYEGLFAMRVGDLESATLAFETSERSARRVGSRSLYAVAVREHAAVLNQLGRSRDALVHLEKVIEPSGGKCTDHARAAWFALDAAGVGVVAAPSASRPEDMMARARWHTQRQLERCRSDEQLTNARLDDALIAIEDGNLSRALAAADATDKTPRATGTQRLWALELRGRVAFVRGDLRGAEMYWRQMVGEAGSGHVRMQLRAWFGLGRTLARQGRRAEALAAYREVESLLDDASTLLAGSARGTQTVSIDRAVTTALIDAYWSAGEHRSAAVAARRAANRQLLTSVLGVRRAALGERPGSRLETELHRARTIRDQLALLRTQAWSLPADRVAEHVAMEQSVARLWRTILSSALGQLWRDEFAFQLREPGPGTVHLTLFPIRDGWAIVATRDDETVASALRSGPGDLETAGALLTAIRDSVVGARQVVIVATGAMAEIPIARASIGDQQLGLALPLVHGHDLATSSASREAGPLVVVADPAGTLVHARREADNVARRFADAIVLSRERIARERLEHWSAKAGLLYLTGATQPASLGWRGHGVSLAGGELWTAGDVLGLAAVPPRVVLSACSAGAARDDHGGAALGLAQAFVGRGALEVLAPTEQVDDDFAAKLGIRVAHHFVEHRSLAVALHRARLDLQDDGPWWAFRVFAR